MAKRSIIIPGPFPRSAWSGFAPAYWSELNDWPTYGNANMAATMTHVNLFDPNAMTQGFGLANLTNGTQAGALATLPRGMLRVPVSSNLAYATGGARLYQFSASTLTSDATWPHTINKAVVTGEDGEDVAHYQGGVFYSYNHSGTQGDIGRYDVAGATFDDDYWTDTLAGTVLVGGVSHQMLVGGDDILYIANGRFIASLNGTTDNDQALDFPQNSVVESLAWNNDRIIAAVNYPNLTGNNESASQIYRWNTISSSWEGNPITVQGRITALYTWRGMTFVFTQRIDAASGADAITDIGIISGVQVRLVTSVVGTAPRYYQVTTYRNHLLWISGADVFVWGAIAEDVPVKTFECADAGYATVGGLSAVFGIPTVASDDGAGNRRFAYFSGYDTNSSWRSMAFPISDGEFKGRVSRVTIYVNTMAESAALDATLAYDNGATTTALTQISQASNNGTRLHLLVPQSAVQVEDAQLRLSWANGSATNPVVVRRIIIDIDDFVEAK